MSGARIRIARTMTGRIAMKENNSFGKIGFAIVHALLAAVAWVWYQCLLFRRIGSLAFSESKLALLAIVFFSCAFWVLFEMKCGRNWFNVFLNLASAYGLYTVLAYFQERRAFISITLAIAAALSAIFSICILCRKMKNKKKAKTIARKRAAMAIAVSRSMFGISLSFIMLAIWSVPLSIL